ncbi:ATP-binding protein [Streptomyces sp. NPDC051214]|uniref:ATP-binding protein n=1 Tax=Streptomyces sp. NPDC051214 TaxID=3155282 RepID=UPI00344A90E6
MSVPDACRSQSLSACRRLPGHSERTPGEARAYVGVTLADWGVAEAVRADLQLIVSELATNALAYTRSPEIVVSICLGAGTASVGVEDCGPHRRLTPQCPGSEAERGRGLLIVKELASRWEQSRADNGGTTVRAEIDLPTHQRLSTGHTIKEAPDAARPHP